MGFWIFMLIIDLLIPVMLIAFGRYFSKNEPKSFSGRAPKSSSAIYGYRTNRSMKSKETWEFAHKYCSKLWLSSGRILLLVTVGAMLLVLGKGNELIGKVGGILCGIQFIYLIVTIYLVETALKKNFDKDGNKKEAM